MLHVIGNIERVNVNKQKLRYWFEINPNCLHENLSILKMLQFGMQCHLALSLDPFFQNDNGNTEEINAERYADMLVTFDLPGFNEHDPDEKTLDKFYQTHVSWSSNQQKW